jgi:hypothetical protein
MSKFVAEFPFQIVFPCIFSCVAPRAPPGGRPAGAQSADRHTRTCCVHSVIVYFLVGLQSDTSKFFIFVADTVFLCAPRRRSRVFLCRVVRSGCSRSLLCSAARPRVG